MSGGGRRENHWLGVRLFQAGPHVGQSTLGYCVRIGSRMGLVLDDQRDLPFPQSSGSGTFVSARLARFGPWQWDLTLK